MKRIWRSSKYGDEGDRNDIEVIDSYSKSLLWIWKAIAPFCSDVGAPPQTRPTGRTHSTIALRQKLGLLGYYLLIQKNLISPYASIIHSNAPKSIPADPAGGAAQSSMENYCLDFKSSYFIKYSSKMRQTCWHILRPI